MDASTLNDNAIRPEFYDLDHEQLLLTNRPYQTTMEFHNSPFQEFYSKSALKRNLRKY